MSANDYYAVLGVDRGESLQGIQAAYRRLAKQCHPDHAGMEGKEQFQAIQEAYEVLSDPGKRKEYDASIERRRRIRGSGGIGPEPVASTQQPSRFRGPEPLVRPSVHAEEIEDIAAPVSVRCRFCHGFKSGPGLSCPFCHGFDAMEREMTEFMMRCLSTFRFPRF